MFNTPSMETRLSRMRKMGDVMTELTRVRGSKFRMYARIG